MTSSWSRASALSAVADIDGQFSIDKVPAGAYYVIAELAGYVSPVSGLSDPERNGPDARTLAAVQSRARRDHRSPGGRSSDVVLELQRGAILGRHRNLQ